MKDRNWTGNKTESENEDDVQMEQEKESQDLSNEGNT